MTDDSTDTTPERTDLEDDESSPTDATEPTDADGSERGSAPVSSGTGNRSAGPGGRSATSYLEWGAFAVLTALALVATYRFYLTASRAIEIWFTADYVPVLQAVFNLVVLVVAVTGLSVLVRRMQGERLLGPS